MTSRSLLLALLSAVFAAIVLGLGAGATPIPPSEVAKALLAAVGLGPGVAPETALVIYDLRGPRIVLGLLAGAALAGSGGLTQGIFRNPLADPGLLGIAGGAALAACLALVAGTPTTGPGALMLPAAAFTGALAAAAVAWSLAAQPGALRVTSLLLAGIAVNAIAGAATGLLMLVAKESQVVGLTFWTMGSLGGATWARVATLAPVVLIGGFLGLRLARPLDALLLGEDEAGHLGVDVRRLRRHAVILTALLTGATVSLCGVIGFIGLVAPHLIRLGFGPGHRVLLPASALLGAALLISADTLARTVAAPLELPIGALTTLLATPVFLHLLRREVAL